MQLETASSFSSVLSARQCADDDVGDQADRRKHGVQHRLRVAGLRLGVILPVLLLTAAADHAVAQLLEGSQRGKCDEQKEQQTLNGLRRHFSERR